MDLNLTQQAESLELVHAEVKDFKEIINDTKKGQKILEQCVQDQTTEIAEIREDINKLERKSRENNLRIVGMKVDENEVPIDLVKGVLSNKFGLPEIELEVAHRTGKIKYVRGVKQPRHIIFKVQRRDDNYAILKKKRESLQHEAYYITDDMTDADLAKKIGLKLVIEDAKRQNKRWRFKKGVNNRRPSVQTTCTYRSTLERPATI